MPTQLPRAGVVLTEEQHALLSELVSLGGARSIAGFIREALDELTPALRVTVPMLRAAVEGQEHALEGLRMPFKALVAKGEEQLDLLDAAAKARSVPSGSEGAPRLRRRGGRRG